MQNDVYSTDWLIENIYNKDKLIDKIGVYRFNRYNETVYVGSSKSLCQRVPSSLMDKFRYDSRDIKLQYLFTETIAESLEVEKYYIKYLKPKENLVHNTKPKIEVNNSMPLLCDEISIEYIPFMEALFSDF